MNSKFSGWFFRNTANAVTLFGFALCFPLLWLVVGHREKIWTILFLASAVFLTDLLDGKLARRLKIITRFGSAADRLRDKVVLAIMFAFLILDQRVDPWIKGVTCLLVLVEACLLVLWIIGVVKRMDVSASWWGKVKMFLMSVGILICLFCLAVEEYWRVKLPFIIIAILCAAFMVSFVLGAKSFTAHVAQYCSQLRGAK